VRPTSDSPAPRSKTSSVSEGQSETIFTTGAYTAVSPILKRQPAAA
jgi:hypothetical protein